MKGNAQSQHNILKEHLNLYFKKTYPTSLEKNYLQNYRTAMSTKMTAFFANMFMGKAESQILNQSTLKPLIWKRYIDDITFFSIWNIDKSEVTHFIEQANNHNPTVKFKAEVSNMETTFLKTKVCTGKRFAKESRLDIKTHFKATETFQYTHSFPKFMQFRLQAIPQFSSENGKRIKWLSRRLSLRKRQEMRFSHTEGGLGPSWDVTCPASPVTQFFCFLPYEQQLFLLLLGCFIIFFYKMPPKSRAAKRLLPHNRSPDKSGRKRTRVCMFQGCIFIQNLKIM